ncbi:hypothetical protein TTHERM_000530589 (macronuclear) [Tetrahymena thermophila SB210]|uniref:Uncharacterized protein n=1 Tax=Tetrahymena thermophila (strain SB210) TaxID=312017 RepID=W7X4Y3_TETTS|nr:hypothetical protein TTHERM_000530589 [Tetrahymena thermophila SB210]EWS72467.1 hypothetical protein TTHERM_000530589 [Tetrahymena thermophila SB210]|eukprot:XP_012655012.1 hypothetical protein TTHERM_000530589 [Tetrahymena thermophila SB210]
MCMQEILKKKELSLNFHEKKYKQKIQYILIKKIRYQGCNQSQFLMQNFIMLMAYFSDQERYGRINNLRLVQRNKQSNLVSTIIKLQKLNKIITSKRFIMVLYRAGSYSHCYY